MKTIRKTLLLLPLSLALVLGACGGATEIDLMRRLKRALDPQNTLNPGKVI